MYKNLECFYKTYVYEKVNVIQKLTMNFEGKEI